MSLSPMERELLTRAANNAEAAHTSAAETRVLVETLISGCDELFARTGRGEKDIVRVETRQNDCMARRAHSAGMMPGNQSERLSVKVAVIASIGCAMCGLLGAVVAPIVTAIISRISGQ